MAQLVGLGTRYAVNYSDLGNSETVAMEIKKHSNSAQKVAIS